MAQILLYYCDDMQIMVEVEDNDNCYGLPLRVFEVKGEERQAREVTLYRGGESEAFLVTGWSSDNRGSPCPAYCVPVSDSGDAIAYLLYGGDWGIRFKPVGSSEAWDAHNPSQLGEPYMVLGDLSDVILE